MIDTAARQEEILRAVVVPSLSCGSKEQQEKALLRLELEEDLKELEKRAVVRRRMAR